MRIAVLTSARSGSTSLFYFIKNHLNKDYITISEPFNDDWRTHYGYNKFKIDFFKNKSNIFIKTFVSVDQIPLEFIGKEDEYWIWFKQYFDKIILLDRKNKDLQSESLAYLMTKKNNFSWQRKQFYDLNLVTEEQLKHAKNRLLFESEFIHSMSNEYPLFYFEDIYIKKDKETVKTLLKYLDLELMDIFYNMFIESDEQRVRLSEEEAKIKKLI
jgi:hypothetical protein